MQTPKLILRDIPNLNKIEVYLENGGFDSFRKAIATTPDDVIDVVKKSGLRGRGGACFPTGLKWSFMPKGDGIIRYLACNGDESEPGSFKDRKIFEDNPFQLIEGMLIAGYAMQITAAYLYIRGEYHKQYDIMQAALDEAYARGFVGEKMKETFGTNFSMNIYLHKGAGAYVCGEETAQMTSAEGYRGTPRIKPPFPAQSGLWGKPTTVNNVETIATVPAIFCIGAEEFSKIGEPKHCGTLLFGVSGHVNKPGVYELPTGTLLTDIIENYAGGVRGGKKIKAVIPGGASMPVLRADEIEGLPMDAEHLKAIGSGVGTGGIMVMDEDTDVVHVARRISHFFHHESCGQCTPCRAGTGWMEKILTRIDEGDAVKSDIDLLISVAEQIEGRTICALGDAAAWPPKWFAKKFRADFEKKCKDEIVRTPKNIVLGKQNSPESLQYIVK